MLAKKASQLFGNKASGVMTNVPGPREPLFIDGKRLRDVMFWVPHPAKLGLGIVALMLLVTLTGSSIGWMARALASDTNRIVTALAGG